MKHDKRRQALLYIFLTITGTMTLGIGLPDLRLHPGLPIPGAITNSTTSQTIRPGTGTSNLSFPYMLQVGLALGSLLMFIAFITALVKKANIKKIGLFAGGFAVLFGIFSRLPYLATSRPGLLPTDSHIAPRPKFEFNVAPIGDPPAGFFLVTAAILLLICLVVVGWLLSRAFQRSRKEDPLAVESEAAVLAIANGQSLSDVIIRCYLNMESIIAQERGIDRDQSMTPHEFESHLTNKGIPKMPIQQLTTLFEKARYGNQCLTEQDELDALNSLSAIQKACQLIMERNR